MTRQRYSIKESLLRILRLFENRPVSSDAPNTVDGELLSENESLSDLAELLAGSLPNETATLPSAITVLEGNIPTGTFSSPSHTHTGNLNLETLRVGISPNYAYIESDGTFRLTGSATTWEDLRIDGLATKVGVTAPTDEVGFGGDNNYIARNFVHNQADEVQFQVQMPHAWRAGSNLSPHVHISPWITGTANVQAVRFIMDYYWSNIDGNFIGTTGSVTMSYTWTGSNQWKHLLIDHEGNDINGSGKTLSSILKCRLFRDNSIANNLAGKVTFLYTDIHYEVDSFGSKDEYIK